MAHIWTDSGLSALLGIFPRTASAQPTALWMGLFASQTSGTVPSRSAYGGASPSGWTETPMWTAQRQPFSANQWGDPIISAGGIAITGRQATFATATGGGQSANGFFLSNRPSSVAGEVILFFSNFDDLTALAIASGDVVRVTPTIRFNVSGGAS